MSSNSNHTNIHLGNYEEFFFLYLDNELSPGQKEMVDEFLKVHPDLRAELELLKSTKLPAEEIQIPSKESLLANQMKLTATGEELLLYIDGELDPEKTKAFEQQLAADEPLQLQHQTVLRAKLDATEYIPYPNKEELYRRTERRVVSFRIWMSVAAAVLLIGFMGILYWSNPVMPPKNDDGVAQAEPAVKTPVNHNIQGPSNNYPESIEKDLLASVEGSKGEKNNASVKPVPQVNKSQRVQQNIVDQMPEVSDQTAKVNSPEEPLRRTTSANVDAASFALAPKQILNNSIVTSSLSERNTIVNATPKISPDPEPGDEVAKKGSIKGFLRKATRLVERTTGITATNDDGELLIGAVAVRLN